MSDDADPAWEPGAPEGDPSVAGGPEPEAAEADVLEQRRPVDDPEAGHGPPSRDVPEADALEQQATVADDEEQYGR